MYKEELLSFKWLNILSPGKITSLTVLHITLCWLIIFMSLSVSISLIYSLIQSNFQFNQPGDNVLEDLYTIEHDHCIMLWHLKLPGMEYLVPELPGLLKKVTDSGLTLCKTPQLTVKLLNNVTSKFLVIRQAFSLISSLWTHWS